MAVQNSQDEWLEKQIESERVISSLEAEVSNLKVGHTSKVMYLDIYIAHFLYVSLRSIQFPCEVFDLTVAVLNLIRGLLEMTWRKFLCH